MLSQTNISSQNKTNNTIGENFVVLSTIDSTNTYAMKQIVAKMAEHGTVFFAHEQTAGKGQKDKKWLSETGSNIVISIVIKASELKTHLQFYISTVAALATIDLLKKYTQEKLSIKWPNDIYINDNKAAGILIENKLMGNIWQWCVVGIGININQQAFDETIPNATSLSVETNKHYDVIMLSKELCTYVDLRYKQLLNKQYKTLLNEYNQYLYKRNEVVNLKMNNISFNCIIKEVNDLGKLIVENGLQNEFDFGEVQWIIKK